MTVQEYREIIESLRWAEARDMVGLVQFYNDVLNDADKRGRLPDEAYPAEEPSADERPE